MKTSILKKFLIVIVAIAILSVFVIPNKSHAGWLSDIGNNLLNAVFDLIRFIGDVILGIMQKLMTGYSMDVSNGIYYSPGIIFSNKVPGLKVNFITATDKDNMSTNQEITSDNLKENIENHYKNYKSEHVATYLFKIDEDNLNNVSISGVDLASLNEETKKWMIDLGGLTEEDGKDFFERYERILDKLGFFAINYVDKLLSGGNLADVTGITDNDRRDIVAVANIIKNNDLLNKWSVENRYKYINTQIGLNNISIIRNWRASANDYVPVVVYKYVYNGNSSAEYYRITPSFSSGESKLIKLFNNDGNLIYVKNEETNWFENFREGSNNELEVLWGGADLEHESQILIYNYDGYIYILKCLDYAGDGYNPEFKKTIEVYRFELGGLRNSIESTAYQLQDTIATWYKTIRIISMVGLLSVLLYIGIRIILSSTSAQNQAKYKNMLKDWLVALCLIFVLHYMMALMLTITESLNNIMADTYNGDRDQLMESVRENTNKVADGSIQFDDDSSNNIQRFGYLIMYLALVLLTLIFTFQYLKRVVYMAFLTMIAPLIALTYPLDKIKDNKAQAFSFWLKEYIFNCLIQPVHLLLYTVFISSALDFAQKNILYAIVTLAFMVPAEKIIKEMFGLKSSGPSGALNAAAGGAVVMSMLNKMKGGRPPQDKGKGSEGGNSVNRIRTPRNTSATSTGAPRTGGEALEGGSIAGASTAGSTGRATVRTSTASSSSSSSSAGSVSRSTPSSSAGSVSRSATSSASSSTSGAATTSSDGTIKGSRFRGVVGGLGKKYIYGYDAIKSHTGRLTGTLGAAVAGTIGLAAQIADGDLIEDPTKAFTQAATAAGAGYIGGSALAQNAVHKVHNAPGKIKEVANAYNEGKYAKEYKDLNLDGASIRKAVQNGINGNEVESFMDAGVNDVDTMARIKQAGINGEGYEAFKDAGVNSVKKMIKLQNQGISGQDYSNLKKIKSLAGKHFDTETDFVTHIRMMKPGMTEDEAKEMYRKIIDIETL